MLENAKNNCRYFYFVNLSDIEQTIGLPNSGKREIEDEIKFKGIILPNTTIGKIEKEILGDKFQTVTIKLLVEKGIIPNINNTLVKLDDIYYEIVEYVNYGVCKTMLYLQEGTDKLIV